MSDDTRPQPSYASDRAPVHGLLAEFDDVTALTRACERVRDAGFTKWDAHTPFPVHGLDAAMGVRQTRLPWGVLGLGLFGMAFGMWLQCWTMGIDYRYMISGKPFFSVPAFIPVAFELTVLLAGFGCFFGSLALNKLPDFFHPLNLVPQFRRVTDDRFFIYVEAKDPKFEAGAVETLLQGTQPLSVQTVRYETQGLHTHLPKGTMGIAAILGVLSLVPFALSARARERTSPLPRLHPNPPAPVKDDMDRQFKFKPQTTNWFFADGRAMRNWPHGTVAEEDPVDNTPFWSGRVVSAAVAVAPGDAGQPTAPEVRHPVHENRLRGAHSAQPATAPVTPSVAEKGYVTEIPAEVPLSEASMARGQQRFNIYCSTCHGYTGHGNGMVDRHAEALQEGTWVTPSNLHDERVRNLAAGDLFNTITHGVRNMPGYGHIVEPVDRWLIVAYVKALQRSLHAAEQDVPADVRPTLQ